MAIKTILCDLDGTLTTSLDAFEQAETLAFAEFGVELTPEDFVKMSISGVRQSFQLLYARIDPAEHTALSHARRKHAVRLLAERTNLYSDVVPMTQMLRSANIDHGIVTSARGVHIDAMHTRTSIRSVMHILSDGDDVGFFTKPNPYGLEIACHKLQVAPEDCLYLGDASFDMEAAARIGMPSCLVIRPESDTRKIRDAWPWATYTVESLSEIARLIS